MSSNNGAAHQNAETKHADINPLADIGRLTVTSWASHNKHVADAEKRVHDRIRQILDACEHAKSVVPGAPSPGTVAMDIIGKIRGLAFSIADKDLTAMSFDHGVFARTIGSMCIDMQRLAQISNTQHQRMEIMEKSMHELRGMSLTTNEVFVGLATLVPGALPDGPLTTEGMTRLADLADTKRQHPTPEQTDEPVQPGETMPEIDHTATDQPDEPAPEDGQAG